MDLEAENIGIRVRGGGGEEVMSEDEEELTEPNVTGTGMSHEDVTGVYARSHERLCVSLKTPPP
jgi:hypothetical protein